LTLFVSPTHAWPLELFVQSTQAFPLEPHAVGSRPIAQRAMVMSQHPCEVAPQNGQK
jgi:hypothetical protein